MREPVKRCLVVSILFATASIAAAEGAWELPGGAEPRVVAPAPMPQGMVGAITFEEAEFPLDTLVDGLVVTTLDGSPLPAPLSFGFSSMDSTINGGPGDITYVQIPNIEGAAMGTLSIDFGLDATSMTYGFALACGGPVPNGTTAQALDSNDNPVGSPVSIDGLDFGSGFAENQLTLAPGGAFRRAEITFNSLSGDCGRFAFDNLAYDGQPVPTLPLPTLVILSTLLLLAGVTVLTLRRF